jgi:acetyl esterase
MKNYCCSGAYGQLQHQAISEEFGVDPTRLAVAGDSVGGSMATVREGEVRPQIAGLLLFYPVTNADFKTASYQQFADGSWLTLLTIQWSFWASIFPITTRLASKS